MDEPDLAAAVAALAALKAEHRQLLLRIAADPGMEPATRVALLEHALEEEDETIARIAALVNGRTGARRERGLTVGSLRPKEPAGRTLGGLGRGPGTRGRGDRTR